MSPTISPRSRWLSLLTLCTAQVMIILDQNIVNVALPAIRRDLAFSQGDLVWTVNAYVIPFGGLLLLAGRLGDLLSRKYVFLTGLGLFTVASLLCGLSASQTMLLVSRFFQGIGGAVTAAGLLGMVVTIFTDPKERAKAIGAFGFASAGGGAAGAVVGGVLTETLGWHWVFLINLPVGALVAALALWRLPNDRGIGWRAGADLLGAVLVTSGLMLAVYTLVEVEQHGWGSPRTIGTGAIAMLLVAGFIVRQARTATPLLPLRILRSANVSSANVVQALMVGALFGFMFFTVLYLQQVLGYDPLSAGLAFLPAPAVIAAVSLGLAPRLIPRVGPRRLILTGLPLIVVGLALLSRVRLDGTFLVDVAPATVIMALGFGITMPSLMTLGMSEADPRDSGVTSGLFNTTQQIGGAIGLAVLSTASASRIASLTADGATATAAYLGGYRLAFTIAAGLAALALLVAASVLRTAKASPTTDEPAPAVSRP